MSRINFRDDRRISTYGYLDRRGRSFDRSPIAHRCGARTVRSLRSVTGGHEYDRLDSDHAECEGVSSNIITNSELVFLYTALLEP